MNKAKVANKVLDDVVTVVAILGIVYLGSIGVIDPMIVGAVAGLGGYRLHKNRQK